MAPSDVSGAALSARERKWQSGRQKRGCLRPGADLALRVPPQAPQVSPKRRPTSRPSLGRPPPRERGAAGPQCRGCTSVARNKPPPSALFVHN
jgi:hypothetical protein